MNELLLQMQHVTKRFPGVLALSDVNIELYKGEILGICGENGAGKSTLMNVLSGSYPHGEYDGEILIDNQEVIFDSVASAQKHGIEMVYQEMNMILDVSIAENMFVGKLPGRREWVNYRALYRETNKQLEKIQLKLDPRMSVRSLNSGQMQLISLMRACVKKPRILVLDEPTSALTNTEVDILMNVLDDLRKSGVSCIYISHKLDEIYRICDRVTVMRDGGVVGNHAIGSVDQDELIEEMVGRKVENLYPKKEQHIGEEILRIENLSVPHPNIKGKKIVNNLSLCLNKGEILGIGGLVGSGRSEMLGAIFGQITHGVEKDVFIEGKKVKIDSPLDAIKLGIGFLTEERKRNGIIWMLSVRENMTLPSLRELPGKLFVNQKVEKHKTNAMMKQLKIKAPTVETLILNLSGGNQQKVILGKWLMKNPKILFMDEPTRGIDVGTKAAFYEIMGTLVQSGVSIIMVSSDMPELISMSDRCLVLCDGTITAELHKGDITETNVMRNCIRTVKEKSHENAAV
ncbi:sugar ABC transporter ATP-binding protein [bacterium]|nr:sugar ABC transporter ATP-binding protein [candidate division CSSED10-310 bacterium]